jgi:hypothetical protein
VPISFTVPLGAELDGSGCIFEGGFLGTCQVHYINTAGKEVAVNLSFTEVEFTSTDCLGTAVNPTAQPGHLCIYAGSVTGAHPILGDLGIQKASVAAESGAGTAGAAVIFSTTEPSAEGRGTWALSQ